MLVDELRTRFRTMYPQAGEPFVCRAPGRVNLIGEHMDYNGLPVLPMAIEQEIRIAFAGRPDNRVVLANTSDRFPRVEFINEPEIVPSGQGCWENYAKAAVHGLNKRYGVDAFRGLEMLVDSDLPMAAGLSSSSALVVAVSLAYLAILDRSLDQDISRLELADLLATAEHFVGTRGGGMDQGVILNGRSDHACKIDFFPLRVELAPLPDDCVIVVTDSMVKVEKSGAALFRFNAGPRFCHLAAAVVDHALKQEFDDEVSIERLGDLWFGPLCLTHEEATQICERAVPDELLTLEQVAKLLNMPVPAVRERWLGDQPEPEQGFPLKARLRHQLSEYRRVERARDALLARDPEEFGRLMNDSHMSCATDFGISSRELDALVEASRASGALGARLTGAGFGGATISLVKRDQVDAFVDGVTRRYYRDYLSYTGEAPIFVAHSSTGAGYVHS